MEDSRRPPRSPEVTVAELWLTVSPVLRHQIEIGQREEALATLRRLHALAERIVRGSVTSPG